MEGCLVIQECWGPASWAWTQRQPSESLATLPATHTPGSVFTLPSNNRSIENSAAGSSTAVSSRLQPWAQPRTRAPLPCPIHTFFATLPSVPFPQELHPSLGFRCSHHSSGRTCLLTRTLMPLNIIYMLINPKSAFPSLIAPINS